VPTSTMDLGTSLTTELFSIKLWHFMECSVASTGYRIKFLMLKNIQTLRTVFT